MREEKKAVKLFRYIDGVSLSDDMKAQLIAKTKEFERRNTGYEFAGRRVSRLAFAKAGVSAAVVCLLFAGVWVYMNSNPGNLPIMDYTPSESVDNSTSDAFVAERTLPVTQAPSSVGALTEFGASVAAVIEVAETFAATNAATATMQASAPTRQTEPPVLTERPSTASGITRATVPADRPEATTAPNVKVTAPPKTEGPNGGTVVETDPPQTLPPPPPPPIVYMDLSFSGIDDVRLADMVESGEIPETVVNLNLSGNPISDLTPLKRLTHLRELRLPQNFFITDISPLKSLRRLRTLSLAYNFIPPEQVMELREAIPNLEIIDYFEFLI